MEYENRRIVMEGDMRGREWVQGLGNGGGRQGNQDWKKGKINFIEGKVKFIEEKVKFIEKRRGMRTEE